MSAEEDNTFRVLKGQLPLMTSFLCHWGLHQWTKWDNTKKVRTYLHEYIIQRKECAQCADFKERKKYLIQ